MCGDVGNELLSRCLFALVLFCVSMCSSKTADEKTTSALKTRVCREKRREGFYLEEWTISGLQRGQECDI